ncbi:MAG: hypothetical protein ACD_20C00214G0008 [uncultured bacterium]|nr:MAG: hypothetical protein ACD_20C00214G0008 [uncultured bacterium]
MDSGKRYEAFLIKTLHIFCRLLPSRSGVSITNSLIKPEKKRVSIMLTSFTGRVFFTGLGLCELKLPNFIFYTLSIFIISLFI